MHYCCRGEHLKLCTFIDAYQDGIIALNKEAADLQARINSIESKTDLRPGGRLASRLSLYRHRLASLKHKHRAAACWIATVAHPIYSILQKRLGQAYTGIFSRDGSHQASLRFFTNDHGRERGLLLKMTLVELCTEPASEVVSLLIERSVTLPLHDRKGDRLSLDTTITEVLKPFGAY